MTLPFETVHSEKDFLVVAKKSGIATTSPEGYPSLTREVKSSCHSVFCHPTSRLDHGVSGIVVYALTPAANAWILDARRHGDYHREYHALAHGVLPNESGHWNAPISIAADKRLRQAGDGPGMKLAHTEYKVEASNGIASLLHLYPKTGRTHQLRVHAAHAGYALVGDVDYGGEKRVTLDNGRVITARRVMLHCAEVRINHAGRNLDIKVDWPEDMKRVWQDLNDAAN